MMLPERIAALETMSGAQLRAEWERLMKSPAPPAYGAGLLARALAYHLQMKALGGLTSPDLRRLSAVASPTNGAPNGHLHEVRPGTWLSRTWQGEVHQVVVLECEVEYRGQRFSSLSAVAREITGAHWSGSRFFGLHSPRLGKLGVSANAA